MRKFANVQVEAWVARDPACNVTHRLGPEGFPFAATSRCQGSPTALSYYAPERPLSGLSLASPSRASVPAPLQGQHREAHNVYAV